MLEGRNVFLLLFYNQFLHNGIYCGNCLMMVSGVAVHHKDLGLIPGSNFFFLRTDQKTWRRLKIYDDLNPSLNLHEKLYVRR